MSGVADKKPVFALVGGIGSGKSRVAAEFVRHGGYLISGDQLGHEALRQPAIRAGVVERWGTGVLDTQGEVDRRKVAVLVFADQAQLRELERLVFPWIERRIREEIAAGRKDPRVGFIVLDAAVLLEAGWNGEVDLLIFVHAPRDLRMQRLARQRGWTESEVEQRSKAQMTLTDKVSLADDVVDNAGPPEDTARQVEDLLRRRHLIPPARRPAGPTNG